MSILKDKIKDFPKTPGVYQFIGEAGEILYIGKAKSLHNRLKSYFTKEIGRGPGIDMMVTRAEDIKTYETESEIEAVILEADLIGKLKPKYNIRQKDDKSFLAIKITKPKSSSRPQEHRLNNNKIEPDEFSCVGLVRFRDVDLSDKSAWYFGPYPSGDLVKRSMRYLRRIFPFRDCSDRKFGRYSSFDRTCLYGDIGICPGVCNIKTPPHLPLKRGGNEITKEEYQKSIRHFIDFLRGKKGKIIKNLEREMVKLSKEKKFEQAGIIRDRLRALGHLKDVAIGIKDDVVTPTNTLFKRIECYDISNIQGRFAVGSMVVFENGESDKDEYRKFRIKNYELGIKESKIGDIQMMEEVLRRRFKNDWPQPNLIIIDGGLTHLNLVKKIIADLRLDIPVISIAKGPERKKNEFHFSSQSVAKYFQHNFDLQRIAVKARNEAHRFAIGYYRKLHSKNMLES